MHSNDNTSGSLAPNYSFTFSDVQDIGDIAFDTQGNRLIVHLESSGIEVWSALWSYWPEVAPIILVLCFVILLANWWRSIRSPQQKKHYYCAKCKYCVLDRRSGFCSECGTDLALRNPIAGRHWPSRIRVSLISFSTIASLYGLMIVLHASRIIEVPHFLQWWHSGPLEFLGKQYWPLNSRLRQYASIVAVELGKTGNNLTTLWRGELCGSHGQAAIFPSIHAVVVAMQGENVVAIDWTTKKNVATLHRSALGYNSTVQWWILASERSSDDSVYLAVSEPSATTCKIIAWKPRLGSWEQLEQITRPVSEDNYTFPQAAVLRNENKGQYLQRLDDNRLQETSAYAEIVAALDECIDERLPWDPLWDWGRHSAFVYNNRALIVRQGACVIEYSPNDIPTIRLLANHPFVTTAGTVRVSLASRFGVISSHNEVVLVARSEDSVQKCAWAMGASLSDGSWTWGLPISGVDGLATFASADGQWVGIVCKSEAHLRADKTLQVPAVIVNMYHYQSLEQLSNGYY